MRQHEIRRVRGGRGNAGLVVVLQSDFTDLFDTCVAAPLALRSDLPAMPRLRPSIRVDDQDRVIVVERLAAINRSSIGEIVGSADHLRDEITRALDLLFTGF